MPSSGGSSTTVSQQQLAPEQQEILSMVMPAVRGHMSRPLQLYPGSTIADPTQTQRFARQQIAETAGEVDNFSQGIIDAARGLTHRGSVEGAQGATDLTGAIAPSTDTLGQLLEGYGQDQAGRDFLRSGALLHPDTNPVLEASTQAAIRPIEESLRERVLPGISSNFVGNNMFGSSRQGIAEGQAIDEFVKQAGDVATQIQMNSFDRGLGAMLSSLNTGEQAAVSGIGSGLDAGEAGTAMFLDAALRSMAESPSLAQLAFVPGMTMEGLGAMDQQLNQARLSEQAERYMTQQMLPFLQAQDVANLAFGIGGGSATTTGQQNPAFDPVQTGMGALMLPLMMSTLGIPLPFL